MEVDIEAVGLEEDIDILFTHLKHLGIIVLLEVHHAFIDFIVEDGCAAKALIVFDDPNPVQVDPVGPLGFQHDLQPAKGEQAAFTALQGATDIRITQQPANRLHRPYRSI